MHGAAGHEPAPVPCSAPVAAALESPSAGASTPQPSQHGLSEAQPVSPGEALSLLFLIPHFGTALPGIVNSHGFGAHLDLPFLLAPAVRQSHLH